MRLVEIRDLDGPNVFLLKPAIKIEIALDGSHIEPVKAIEPVICDLHRQAGAALPDVITVPIETPDHVVLAFSWQHRRLALGVAEAAARIATGESIDLTTVAERLREIGATFDDDDAPLLVRDAERKTRAVAVTGTNGKTTTTRLIAHIARLAHPLASILTGPKCSRVTIPVRPVLGASSRSLGSTWRFSKRPAEESCCAASPTKVTT